MSRYVRRAPYSTRGIDASTARAILAECNVKLGADFHVLPAATVDRLIEHADARRYRKPKAANGSRGRYWHAYLQRAARRLSAEQISAMVFGERRNG